MQCINLKIQAPHCDTNFVESVMRRKCVCVCMCTVAYNQNNYENSRLSFSDGLCMRYV